MPLPLVRPYIPPPRILPSPVVLEGLGAVGDLDELLHDVTDVLSDVAAHEDLLAEGDAVRRTGVR